MKWFGRTGGYYLFWVGAVYLLVGTVNTFVYKFAPSEILSLTWIAVLCLPFAVPQLGRWLNMSMPWDPKEPVVTNNVVPFPEPKLSPAPKPKAEEHYRVGFTTDGETTLTLIAPGGTVTMTMSRDSTEQLIKMLRATYTDEE